MVKKPAAVTANFTSLPYNMVSKSTVSTDKR